MTHIYIVSDGSGLNAYRPEEKSQAVAEVRSYINQGEGDVTMRKVTLIGGSPSVSEPLCSCIDGEFRDHEK